MFIAVHFSIPIQFYSTKSMDISSFKLEQQNGNDNISLVHLCFYNIQFA